MKKYVLAALFSIIATGVVSNEIYISQIGDNLTLDITQAGNSNRVGDLTGSTPTELNGDNMTFSITQTGDSNTIDAIINGNTYTGTWSFVGNNNIVDMTCSSLATGTCETVTVDITTNGNDNIFNVYIGEVGDAMDLIVDFTIDGDGNTIDATLDAAYADVTLIIDNSTSIAGGNTFTIDQDDAGGVNGHSITYDMTGGGNTVTITQSGLTDQTVDIVSVGDNQNVTIIQSD